MLDSTSMTTNSGKKVRVNLFEISNNELELYELFVSKIKLVPNGTYPSVKIVSDCQKTYDSVIDDTFDNESQVLCDCLEDLPQSEFIEVLKENNNKLIMIIF